MTKTPAANLPRILVFGNEKGGTGKSTLAMHVAVVLLNRGLNVATVDLDTRQGTMTRYAANREAFVERTGKQVPRSLHFILPPPVTRQEGESEFTNILMETSGHDVVVVDTPGHDTPLSHFAHSHADVIVTPINDSLIDLDVLASVDPVKRAILRPSHYSERVWKAKQGRATRDGGSIDWVVVRNRMGQLDARNKRLVGKLLNDLAKRIGFRTADGIAERVIYRELFLDGLTVEDLAVLEDAGTLAMSHVAARQELRSLMSTLGLPEEQIGKKTSGRMRAAV